MKKKKGSDSIARPRSIDLTHKLRRWNRSLRTLMSKLKRNCKGKFSKREKAMNDSTVPQTYITVKSFWQGLTSRFSLRLTTCIFKSLKSEGMTSKA